MWSGPNGFFSTIPDTLATAPGIYGLTITDPSNGCTSTTSATVVSIKNIPTATAGPDKMLTCSTSSVTLDGNGGAPGGASFLWIGPGISAPQNTIAASTADQSGEFVLEVTDNVSRCKTTDTVHIVTDVQPPAIYSSSQPVITCDSTSVTLGVGCQNCPNFPYSWAGPGISIQNQSQIAPVVSQPGSYSVTVTSLFNGCTAVLSLSVDLDNAPPIAEAGPNQTLTCKADGDVDLEPDGSSVGPQFVYTWSGPTVTANNEHLYEIEVTQPGLFHLLVLNTLNGCSASDSTTVFPDLNAPIADAGPDQLIDCFGTAALDGSGSSMGTNFIVQWSGPDGFTSSSYSPTGITVAGEYKLTITNTSTNCKSIDKAVVGYAANPLVANAGPDQYLTCKNNAIATLSSTGSTSGAAISYQWSGPQSGSGTVFNVTKPGVYLLTVILGNCTATDLVAVSDLTGSPIASAGPDLTIDCTTGSVKIQSGGSSTGPSIFYTWTGPGISPAEANLQSPTVSLPGTYQLTAVDTVSGCTATDQMEVKLDAGKPLAAAGPDRTLTCTYPTATLDGSASSAGPSFSKTWSGPDINAGNMGLASPVVNLPGTYFIQVKNTANGCESADTVLVLLNKTTPTAAAGPDKTLTCTTTTAALDGSASSPVSTADYLWTGGPTPANSPTPTVSQPGVFTLKLTDKTSGCTDVDMVAVAIDTVHPKAAAGPDGLISCTSTSFTLDGSMSSSGANFTVNWIGPGITPASQSLSKPTVNVPGSYALTITNQTNGCSATDGATVSKDQNLPTAAAGPDKTLTCSNTSVALDGSGSSAGPSFTYKWSGPGISGANMAQQSPTVGQPGTYQITVTNAATGCTAEDIVQVFLDNAAPVFTTTTITLTCAMPSGKISAVCPDPLATYLWSGPAIQSGDEKKSSPTVSQSGTYSVTVTAPNGCTASATVAVLDDGATPTGTATGDTLTCFNNGQGILIAQSSTPGVGFKWSGPGGQTGSGPTLAATVPGSYSVTITAANGCTKQLTVNVLDDRQPPKAVASVFEKLDCNTTEVPVSGAGSSIGGEFKYLWTTADGQLSGSTTGIDAVAAKAGNYQFLVTDQSNGCTRAAAVLVENDPSVPTAFFTEKEDVRCFGESNGIISIDSVKGGTKPFSIYFNGQSTSSNYFSKLKAGVYQISLMDALGCQLSTTVTILQPPPVTLDLGPDVEIFLGDSVLVKGLTNLKPSQIAAINWQPPLGCGKCLADFVMPFQSVRYLATVADSAGCAATDGVNIKVNRIKNVYIPNAFAPESNNNFFFTVFGNQAVLKIKELQIFDRWGELVFVNKNFKPNDIHAGWNGRANGKDAAGGVYVYWVLVAYVDGSEELFKGGLTLTR